MVAPDRRQFVTALAGAALVGLRLGRRGPPASDRPWIPTDPFLADLPRLMELSGVPGVSVAVVEEGEVAWRRALGVANAETGEPVREDSVFPAASLGKPVFGSVVMGLAEEGRLDLDRPLVAVFRPDDLADDPRLDRITPRHVLSHTTGLPNWRGREAKRLEIGFEPGTRFQYSGEGFFWLQRVVETLTGRGIDGVVRDRLFGPARLARATYAWSIDHRRWTVSGHGRRGELARQWNRDLADPLLSVAAKWGRPMTAWTAAGTFRAMEEAGSTLPRQPNFAVPNVAGSLLCTASEYARFMTLMFPRPEASGALSESSRAAMLRPVSTINRALSWGLGWGLEARDQGRLFWHWGDNGIFRAFAVGDPDRRRAIVVLTNSESGPNVYQRVIASATGLDLAAWLWV